MRFLQKAADRQTPAPVQPISSYLLSVMFLLFTAGATEVLGHYKTRSVISTFELHLIHQCADNLQTAPSRAFRRSRANRGCRLSVRTAKLLTLVRDGDYNLIDRLLIKVGGTRNLLGGPGSDQLRLLFNRNHQFKLAGGPRAGAERQAGQGVLEQIEMRVGRAVRA